MSPLNMQPKVADLALTCYYELHLESGGEQITNCATPSTALAMGVRTQDRTGDPWHTS